MAEDAEQDQKTEEPSDKRLQEAHEQGQLPISRDMATFTGLLGIVLIITYFGKPMATDTILALKLFLESPHQINLEGHGLQVALLSILTKMGLATAIIFLLMFVFSTLGTALQTGFFANPEMLKLDFERLSPTRGLQRLFSKNAAVELLKSVIKLVVVGSVAFYLIYKLVKKLAYLTGRDLLEAIDITHGELVSILITLLFMVGVIAVADLVYQRMTFIKQLRMTKTEVKDEYKQMEGDPMIKARLRQIRTEKSRRRMMSKVPKADVVITNPTHYSVALQYDNEKMNAPVVVAKGLDRVAQRIREVALENNVPLVSNPPLARTLHDTVELDEPIKAEHYKAVAEIISYVYKLKKKKF